MASARADAAAPRSPDPARTPAVHAAPSLARNAPGAWRQAHRRTQGVARSGLRPRSVALGVRARLPCAACRASVPRRLPSASATGATHAQLTSSSSNGAPSVSDHRRSSFRRASGNRSSHAARSGVLRQLAASRSGTFNAMLSFWLLQVAIPKKGSRPDSAWITRHPEVGFAPRLAPDLGYDSLSNSGEAGS